MKQHKHFKKKAIASAISSVLLASAPAFSQQDNSQVEEVVVVGIRASLERSMDIKRDSAGVVDAISAEDIGKFPDSNLAESLQRIPGVAIDRVNGEGSAITVRGFGPQFNMVTLNGRNIPGGGVFGGDNGGAINGSTRAFDFANLASESIRGVEVHKTGRASIETGGIGSSVNIKTTRPLDSPGLQFTTGFKALRDTTTERGRSVTPEISGLLSWTDEEQKFGAGLSLSVQQRDSHAKGIYNNNWNIARWGVDQPLYSLAPGAEVINPPAEGQLYGRPNDVRYTFADRERERINGQLTLQYAPTESVTATIDYTHAQNQLHERYGESTSWFNNSNTIDRVEFDNSDVASPLFISEKSGVRDHGFAQFLREQENTLSSVGLNVEWLASDRLSLEFDAHSTSMESVPNGPGNSSEVSVSIGLATQVGQTIDYSGEIPIYTIPLDDSLKGNNNGIPDIPDLASQIGRVHYADQKNDISQVRLNGTFEINDDSRFNFGVSTRNMEMNENSSRRQMTLGDWGQNFPGDVLPHLVEPYNLSNFDDYDTSGSFQVGFRGRAEDILRSLVGKYGTAENGYCVCIDPNFSLSDVVEEKTQSIFGEYEFSGQLGEMPYNILAGLRYETTDVFSQSRQRVPLFFEWQDNNDFRLVRKEEAEFVGEKASYDNVLPSLDFNISLTDEITGRASYSKTIGRATYGDLKASVSNYSSGNGSTLLGAQPLADAGNPGLLPLESDNFDLSVEWYYGDASYVSAGLFVKNISNFIGSRQFNDTLFDVRDVTSGPRAQAAQQALIDGGFAVNDTSLFVMLALLDDGQPASAYTGEFDQEVFVGANFDVQPDATDPLTDFLIKEPTNNKDATIDGLELSVQHFFGDTGFGISANYTMVNGDISFNNTGSLKESQFPLVGLSDTANLVGIYEKSGWQVRLAYNWRDEFLNESSRGNSRNPVYIEQYSQLDLNISFDVSDNINVFLEGLNLTGENRRDHGRSTRMIENLEDLGARYAIGARYSF